MSTTQRSESMNAFFDGYVHSKTTLKQFVEQYENALKSKVEKEYQADYESFCKQVGCVTFYDMEKQIQAIYTTSKFKEFQIEVTGMMYCQIISIDGDEMISVYVVARDIVYRERGRKRFVKVHHRRKDVRRCHTRVKISYDGWITTPEQLRYDNMISAFTKVADLAADDEDHYKNVMNWIEGANKNMSLQVTPIVINKNLSVTNDPVIKRGKGRSPCTRKKPIMKRRGKKKITRQDVHDLMEDNAPYLPSQAIVTATYGQLSQQGHIGSSSQVQEGDFMSLIRTISQDGQTSRGSGEYQLDMDGSSQD
ncbi:protein FAR1-RELATED SEQUENCE 6-like [Tripterygium wilfordii]|uniref:protein FAR1-RELATED SEQUENCE 6-like n=1 Tax=Tripterygium wilfordii TaxID=458696 RepID=UPI0018F84068|nr:protein FAR1-RELATED SEQUENCE 6-like [Tripterygium wilfordii]